MSNRNSPRRTGLTSSRLVSGAPALAAALLLCLPLSALAGRSDAEKELIAARANVAAAERADATSRAPQALNTARDMLAQAEGSYEDRDWTDAELEAQRAGLDGRLAEARARQQASESVLRELEATIETLRAEIARQGE
ncbi:MAG: DUF4398 domain-containing protein [Lysobacteraceae bacterium]